jgi:hypothetical protein
LTFKGFESLLKFHHPTITKTKGGSHSKMAAKEVREDLLKEIETLRAELRERKLSLPAHSLRPQQWMVIEELEDKIHGLEEKLTRLDLEAGAGDRR